MDNTVPNSETVIPVVAEELEIGKRLVETGGGVRVHKTVTETTRLVDEPMSIENAEVTRVPINRVVESAPPTRHEGDTMIVSIVEEQLIVDKRLVLREEIHIRKSRESVRHPQTVTLREEHAQVERFGRPSEKTASEETSREEVVHEQQRNPVGGSILNRVFPPGSKQK